MQTGRIGSEGLLDYGRWSVYEYCIDVIRQRPLLGTGAGTFGDVFPSVRGADLSAWGVWDYAHSTILEIAVEMGIPVAFMIGVAAVASVFVLLRAALRSEDRSRSSFSVMAGVAVLTYLHSMIDFSLQIPGYLVVFWILLGCWMARSFEKPNLRARTRGSMAAPSIGEVQEPIGAGVS
jgi:O-antigen ligase